MLRPAVLTLSLAVFATMLGNCIVMSLLPISVQQFGFGELGAGLLFSVHAATRTLILPFTGRLSDRWERKYFRLAGLFFYTATSFASLIASGGLGRALGLAIFPFAGEFWHLLALNIWVGAMYGLAFPSHTAPAMEHGQRYGMGTVTSLLMMAHGVGMMVGPAVFGSLASQSGLTGAFWIGGSAGAMLTVVCAVLVNTDLPRPAARPAARTQPPVAD